MDKNDIFTEQTNVTHGRGYVYLLQYHIVWVTKYRKPVLVGMVAAETKRHLLETMEPVNKDRGTSGNRGSRGETRKACTAYSADCFRKSGTESQNKTRPKGRHQANEAGNTFTSEPPLKNVGSNYIGSSQL